MLRERLERQLREQFQAHIANMTLEGVTGASSNTTEHSSTSSFLHGAGCPRQGATAVSKTQPVVSPSSNTTTHSSTSSILHGAGCLRQGAAAVSKTQPVESTS
jgi:hypothetical protein